MEAGETLARWFVHEAERVYATLGEKPEDRETRRIAELVKRLALRLGGKVRPRDLQRANKGKYPTAEIAEAALDSLVSAGLGSWIEAPIGNRGGRPARVFVSTSQSEADSRQNPTEPPTNETPDEMEQEDTTPETKNEVVEIARESEVVSGFVGCRVELSKPIEPPPSEGRIDEVVSGGKKRKRKAASNTPPDSIFGEDYRGLPD